MVRILPLAEREVRSARALIERMTWELGESELDTLSGLGMYGRRVWVAREVTGPWLYDVIDGSEELVRLGPEAVWATATSSLDHWIAGRLERVCIGDLSSVPDEPPAIDLHITDAAATSEAGARTWKLEVAAPPEGRSVAST